MVVDKQEIQTAQSLDGAQPGENVSVSIRPERISLAGLYGEDPKANVMDCTIENITFLGSIVRIQVRTGENMFYADTFNNPFLELPKIGAKAKITFSKEAVLVLRHST